MDITILKIPVQALIENILESEKEFWPQAYAL
jgi:hypothetical protein